MKNDVDFVWNRNSLQIQNRLGFGPELNKKFADLLVEYSEEFVPRSFTFYGATSQIGQEAKYHMADMYYTRGYSDRGQIVYLKNYAKYQYNKPFDHTHSANPKGTDHWIEMGYRVNRLIIENKLKEEQRRLTKPI